MQLNIQGLVFKTWKGNNLMKYLSKIIISVWLYTTYWTSPGDNIPQDTNYTANCLPSWKLSKLDEPDTQDTAGEAGTSS